MKYTEEAIQAALALINSIDITGVENAKRIVMLDQILRSPEKEAEHVTEHSDKASKKE